ncbi:hypothetical protein N7509_013138 [Penicillium cosmopolitanum]|uniref:Methyltransferase domain-containing protein n=1 Tax=Penicillium cosmopolitanum TaxID=1131564 RepID=A0A9W9SCP9_9EURO|nr:uncharacterized protein N7509_013138 [Penicillium cosmopolitanum]KAJ5376252.1 hypothetical protein N7509_013138 [Penicillium cosmopolitanum]
MVDNSGTSGSRVHHYLQRAYALAESSEAEILYDQWADVYDTDNANGYASPRRCVEAVIKNLSPASDKLKVLDAGCGTGLVGDCLAETSLQFVLDGVDLSAGMLAEARGKGVYRELERANLNEKIAKPDGSYDVVVCVGTLTKGHVGPEVLAELARVATKSGLIVATVHNDIWETGGYKAKIEKLQNDEIVQIISAEEFGILEWKNTGGRMLVVRKR